MAALCGRRGAPETACSQRDHHVRRVAGVVATEKAKIESNIYTLRKADYTAEEWRLLYLTTSVDLYLHSIRLVGFCGFGDIKWAMVTRMKEENNLPRERYYEIFRKRAILFCIICGLSSDFWFSLDGLIRGSTWRIMRTGSSMT